MLESYYSDKLRTEMSGPSNCSFLLFLSPFSWQPAPCRVQQEPLNPVEKSSFLFAGTGWHC